MIAEITFLTSPTFSEAYYKGDYDIDYSFNLDSARFNKANGRLYIGGSSFFSLNLLA